MPDIKLNKKSKEYYKDRIIEILNKESTEYVDKKIKIATAYDIYNGETQNDQYKASLESFNTNENSVPYIWQSINKSKIKARVVIEELDLAGFGFAVEAINEEAKTLKTELYHQSVSTLTQLKTIKQLEKVSGIELDLGLDVSQFGTIQDLRDYYENTYQSNEEVVLETLLKANLSYYEYLEKRLNCFRDLVISGTCSMETTVVNGYPQFFYIHPLSVINDCEGIMDNHQDDKHRLIIDYITESRAIEEYGLSKEKIKETKKNIEEGIDINLLWQGKKSPIDDGHENLLAPFHRHQNEKNERILRVRAYFKETKKVYSIIRKDKYGNDIVKNYYHYDKKEVEKINKALDDKETEVKSKTIETIHSATLIGADLIVNEGECGNIVRDPAKIEYAQYDIHTVSIDRSTGSKGGMMNDIAPLVRLRDYYWTRLQQEIAAYIGDVLVVNPSAIPEGFGSGTEKLKRFMSHLKSEKVLYSTESRRGKELGASAVNISSTQSFQMFVQIQTVIDQQEKDITGVTDTRVGRFYSKNQLAGPTQSLLNQSYATTNIYRRNFKNYENRLINHHLQQLKYMVHLNPERYKKILGVKGVAHLEYSKDILLHEYGIKIHDVVVTWEMVTNIVNQSMFTNGSAEEALSILMSSNSDPKTAARKFIYAQRRIKEQQRQDALIMNQAAQQTALQKEQMRNQGLVEQEATRGQYDLQERKMMSENDRTNTQIREANKSNMQDKKLLAEIEKMIYDEA